MIILILAVFSVVCFILWNWEANESKELSFWREVWRTRGLRL